MGWVCVEISIKFTKLSTQTTLNFPRFEANKSQLGFLSKGLWPDFIRVLPLYQNPYDDVLFFVDAV